MVTLIGIIALILSIIAFFKSEKWLLNLVIFFSVFTAAIAFINPITILPFEIPMILLLLRYVIDFIKTKKKIDFDIIRKTIKNNKIFTAFLLFAIALTISELWMAISGFEYSYYDMLYKEDRIIKFSVGILNQYIRYMFYLVFAMVLSIKIKDRNEIKSYLKVFGYASLFAIVWGFSQHILYSLNISYPAFIFNNNPYAYQGFDQIMSNFNRVNSIALEPSTFALHISVFMPFVLLPWLLSEKQSNKKIFVFAVATIICGLLSFSSTFILSIVIQFAILFFVIVFSRNKNKRKLLLKYIFVTLVSIFLTFTICVSSSFVRNKMVLSDNKTTINGNETNEITEKPAVEQHESEDVIKTFLEITIDKFASGSAAERWAREDEAFAIYKLSPIFGVGITSVRTFTLFTNILVNNGIFGLLTIIYLFYVAIKNLIVKRKEDYKASLVFLFGIIGMLVPFIFSVPDISFIYCWIIIVLSYNYFNCIKKKTKSKKDDIVVGIDARGLDENRTGITVYIEKLLEQFNEMKNLENIKFILYSPRSINLSFEPSEKIEIKVFSKYKKGTIFLRYNLPKILREDNVDVFFGTQHVLPRRCEYTNDIKYIVTVHDLAIHKFKTVGSRKNTIIQRLFLKKSCKEADKIIAVSKSTKKDIVEMFNIPESKVAVVYHGAGFDKKYGISKKEEIKILKKFDVVDKNYLFFVSTIEPRKNIITLIKSFEKLKEKNRDLKLILAGGLGWKYESIIQAIEDSKYKKDINLAGYISKEEKDCLIHNCKCLVYPSLYEGFGFPILEAMSKGTLVVTSNNSSLPEVGGKAALYYNNVLDYNELANVVQKALDMSEKEKEEIVKKGLNQVSSFSWEKCAKETLKSLLELIQ